MAKKATPAPAPAPAEATETPETEATTSAAIDQPAVSDDASASASSPVEQVEPAEPEAPSSPAEPAIVEPEVPAVVEEPAKEEPVKAGGGFEFLLFVEPLKAPTMIERIEALEARVSALEG